MIIDIRGTTTANQGAQLMFEAIVERLGPHFELSCPTPVIDWDFRSRLGVRQDLQINRFPLASSLLSDLTPRAAKLRYGLVASNDVSGVVDASGFAYSDSFGPQVAETEARYGQLWSRRGVPRILLPQAFGPFNNPRVANATRRIIEQSRLVYVRDRVSEEHLHSLRTNTPTVRCPDFTIGLEPHATAELPTHDAFVAIVPNGKMMSKAGLTAKEYISLLAGFASAAGARGLRPVIVNHESSDLETSRNLATLVGGLLFSSPDPRVLKKVLSGAKLVVASRFHAAVGSLSTGVPTITVGWSHKYEELLNDFGVPQWNYASGGDPDDLIKGVLEDKEGSLTLREQKEVLKQKVDEMWRTVQEELTKTAAR